MLLAKDSKQRLQVGDASTVFWSAKESKMEKVFANFFGKTETEEHEDTEAIKALYAAPKTGAKPLNDDLTPFFVLGLSPNASRIAIRFWHSGTVAEVAKNIRQHFDDCEIAHGPKQPKHLPLFRMLVSTAMQGKADNIQPNLAGEVMRAILAGTPYPHTLLQAAVRRNRAEQKVTYERASLIKAVLVREARYRKKEKEAGMSLDREIKNTGYLLGRLFAVLEHAQEWANPSINATIKDRFYGAASSTPVIAFPHLMKLKNHHLAKLENKGSAVFLEKEISGIMAGLSEFPAHLDMADQGRFAVGYYHQRQDFYTKKDKNQ
jgi:CRISPR-associated protein Csd1